VADLLKYEESAAYLEWKRSGHHLEEYAAEGIGTLFLVFCVVGVVAGLFGAHSPLPQWIPSHRLRLFLTGLLLGGASWIVALSPPGRLSGAHLNPAVSLGFWVLGKMQARDLCGYVLGQMLGAGAGALLGRSVFGSLARSVQEAVLKPGPGVGPLATLLAELGTTFVLTLLIYTCVSHQALLRWTPALAAVMVGVLVGLDGSYSGGGMNPARWFGPAFAADYWRLSWAFILGPLVGAILAAGLRRTGVLTEPMPHTGKLFHDPGYRSLFQHDRVPTTAPPRPPREPASKPPPTP
jgi:aquaporin Z